MKSSEVKRKNRKHSHCDSHKKEEYNCCCCGEDSKRNNGVISRIIISAVILCIALVFSHFNFYDFKYSNLLELILYVIAFLFVGIPIILKAIKVGRKGEIFSEFTLMSLASVGAFGIGEYPEGVIVMLLYNIGEYFQDLAVDKTRDNIKSLLALKPTKAVLDLPEKKIVSPNEVNIGDRILVKVGERIPLDVIIDIKDEQMKEVQLYADTSALTGESEPKIFRNGDEILAGMIVSRLENKELDLESISLRVIRKEEESAISKILKKIEEASERKAPTEIFIRKFSKIYTPIMICLAIMIFLVGWLFTGLLEVWLYKGLMFLAISCPCAIVISVPLCYFAGIGAGAKNGILFKGGNSLDALCKVDSIFFDKTGTLTKGYSGDGEGKLYLKEEIKEDSKVAIEKLKQLGIKNLTILSGDKKEKVETVAKRLGIEKFYYSLMPQEKIDIYMAQKGKNSYSSFVGDGINDAPLLKISDVGIAMGALGTDLAIESADVVIQTDQPSKVADSLMIAKKTQYIAKQNITLSLFFKFVVLLLGLCGYAPLWLAVFADSGVALLAVFNSLRVRGKYNY